MSRVISPKETNVEQPPQTSPSEQEPHKRKSHYASYVLFVLFAATLLNALDSNEFTSASTVIARELHLGIGTIGILTSAFTIFLTISIIPIGLWADRAKRTHVIAACLAVWSLATTFTALAGNFLGLFITRVFTGIGEAGYAPAGNSLVGDFFSKEQRPKILSWLALATLVGSILGMVLGGVIAGLAPGAWHWAFLVTGIPGLLLAVCAWRLREPAHQQTTKAPSDELASVITNVQPTQYLTYLWDFLRNKALICVIIYGVLTEFTATALQVYSPTLLQQKDTFGLSSGQAALLAGLALGPTALAGVLTGGYLAGWLSRRYRKANLLICVASVMFTAPLNTATLVVMMTTHNLVLFMAFMLPSFFINTLHIGPLSAAVLDITPAGRRASTIAIYLFIVRILGTATAPLTIGFLASSFDPQGVHFLHNVAGHDLTLALLSTCPLAFIGATCAGLIGLRWMSNNREGTANKNE